MSDLLKKYIIKDNKEEIFHSSAYSRAQNGGSMGSASTESFATRLAREQNRQVIQGYGHSSIATSSIKSGASRPKTFTPEPNANMRKQATSAPARPPISISRPPKSSGI